MLILSIMHKQHTIELFKPWPHVNSFRLHLHEIIAKLRKAMEIPIGYQDETGFHVGDEPAEKEVKRPTVR
jgi:hypothetical protein